MMTFDEALQLKADSLVDKNEFVEINNQQHKILVVPADQKGKIQYMRNYHDNVTDSEARNYSDSFEVAAVHINLAEGLAVFSPWPKK